MLCLLVAMASIGAGQPATGETVRLSGPPIWDSAVLLHLVERQPLKDKGVVFSFAPWKNPNQLRSALLKRNVDLAIVPSVSASLFVNRGIALTLFFTHSLRGNLALVGRGEPPGSLADLPKGAIAVPFKGDLPDLLLQRLGMVREQARYVSGPVEAMNLLLAGQVTYAFLAEPFATLVRTHDPALSDRLAVCDRWESATGRSGCPVLTVVASPVGAIDPSKAALIVDAYEGAFEAVLQNPEKAARLVSEAFPGLPEVVLRRAFENLSGDLDSASMAEARLRRFLDAIVALEPEAIGGKVPDIRFFAAPGASD